SNTSKNNAAESTANGSSAPSASSTASIDVNAPSTSQGVGKFSNVQVGNAIDPKMAEAGQEIFQTKCTACHQATDQRLVGPGLKGITKIRTPAWIMNMITNPDTMTHSDPVAEALYNQYNQTQMTNQGLTDQEAREVLEFLRQNDAQ
ncbi:MAG: c-type cytochrome, partial [Chitinophagaceae bacterium]